MRTSRTTALAGLSVRVRFRRKLSPVNVRILVGAKVSNLSVWCLEGSGLLEIVWRIVQRLSLFVEDERRANVTETRVWSI